MSNFGFADDNKAIIEVNRFINSLMRHGPVVIRMALIVALLTVWLSGGSRAQAAISNHQVSLPVSVTGGAYYSSNGERDTVSDAIYTSAELRFSSRLRNYSLGLFYDYAGSTDEYIDGAQTLGIVHRMRVERWDTATYVFGHKPTRARRRWGLAGRVRYQVAEHHKIGVEAIGAPEDTAPLKLMIGYYGTISESLSARIAVGKVLNIPASQSVQAELNWQIH
jgi:hypothetical protein